MAIFNIPVFDTIRKTIENIIQSSNVASTSATWNNGDDKTVTITTTGKSGAKVLTQQDITVYIDSASAANNFASGGNVTLSQWNIFGPINDYDSTDGIKSVTKIRIVNVSAGTHTLVIKVQTRIIENSFTSGGTNA